MSRGDGLARQLQLRQMLEHRQEIIVPEVAVQLGYTVRTVFAIDLLSEVLTLENLSGVGEKAADRGAVRRPASGTFPCETSTVVPALASKKG